MDRKIIAGSILGALVIFLFSFGLLMILNPWLGALSVSTTHLAVSLIIFLLAPVGGGFLAGQIGQPHPRRAGTLAGAIASGLILVAFVLIFGLSLDILLTALVVAFVWVLLARISAGFAKPR